MSYQSQNLRKRKWPPGPLGPACPDPYVCRLLKGSFHLIVGMSQQCPPIWMPSKTHFAISRIRSRMSWEECDLIRRSWIYPPY